MKLLTIFLVSVLFFTACKKENTDVTENVTVQGNVRNNCTGKGFAGVEVKLTISTKNDATILKSITDSNGNFSFIDLDINNSSKYKYYLSVDTYSNYDYEFFGIGLQELNKSEISKPYQIGLSATAKILYLKYPTNTIISSPDSINLTLEQRTLHFYEPNRVWQIPLPYSKFNNYITENDSGYINNYPMDPWHIIVDKWKNGIHTISEDSIFREMGGTNTYIIPW